MDRQHPPFQVSDLTGPISVDTAPGVPVVMRMSFPLNKLDYRNRFFTEDSFLNLGEAPPDTKLLWQHDSWAPPIGTILSTKVEDGNLVVTAQMAATELAQDIVTLVAMEPPALNTVSIGWMPGSEEVVTLSDDTGHAVRARHQREVMLMDVSPVNYPGMKGTTISHLRDAADYARRMVVHPEGAQRIELDEDYDEAYARDSLQEWAIQTGLLPAAAVDLDVYEQGFASVEGDPHDLASYRFPHHDVDDDEGMYVSRAGVSAAFAAATDAQDEDALTHLARHLAAISGSTEAPLAAWKALCNRIDEYTDQD